MGDFSGFVFLGYRAKRPWNPGPEWAPIDWICNVGEDLCEPPEGWVGRWVFNQAFCYTTPEAAWSTVTEDRAAYRLFAYFLLPVAFDGDASTPMPLDRIFADGLPDLPSPPSAPLKMASLGYDVAEHQFGILGYAYSPLVTSGFSHEFPTNRYGLLDDLDVAVRACATINERMPEHAPHWVFRVFAHEIDESNDVDPGEERNVPE